MLELLQKPQVLADSAKHRYCLRKQVEIDDVSDEYVPWVKFGLDQLLDSAPVCCVAALHLLRAHALLLQAPGPQTHAWLSLASERSRSGQTSWTRARLTCR